MPACAFLFFILPLSTYAAFREDVQIGLLSLIALLAALTTTAAATLHVLRKYLSAPIVNMIDYTLMLVALLLAYNFYTGDYGGRVIGADADVLDGSYALYEFLIFAVALTATALLFRRLRPHYGKIFLVLVLASLANLTPLFSGERQAEVKPYDDPLKHEDFLQFSGRGDIVHIILDGMQGTHFSRALANDKSLAGRFPGFTFFPDTTTSTDVTYLSVPAVLSGRAWDGSGSILAYKRASGIIPAKGNEKPSSASLLNQLNANNFRVEVLAGPGGSMKKMPYYNAYFLTDFLDQQVGLGASLGRLLDLTLIKTMPWSLKRDVYRQGQWLYSSGYGEVTPRAGRAFNFLNQYAANIDAQGEVRRYKLIHLISPHPPWTTGKNCVNLQADAPGRSIFEQARCIMLSVAELVDGMQRIGVYDNSLIVVHGDHGICDRAGLPAHNSENPSIPKCVGNTNPLLMIKLPGKAGALQINDNFVELIDIAPTVMEALSIEHQYPGKNLFDTENTQSRTRYFYKFEPNRVAAAKQDKVDEIIRYEIDGSIFDLDSWCQPGLDSCR